MNAKMAAYGDMAVAGIGVAMKITMITGMVSMGIGQGVQPLLGYCTGARDWKRFRQYFRFSMIFATALGTGLTLLCYGGLNQLGGRRCLLSLPTYQDRVWYIFRCCLSWAVCLGRMVLYGRSRQQILFHLRLGLSCMF